MKDDSSDWRHEFAKALASPDPNDWKCAHALRLAMIPKRLFRYRAPSAASLNGLRNKTIWLSAASEFNDLHDTSVVVDAERGIEAALRKDFTDGKLPLPGETERFLPPISADMIGALDAAFVVEVEKQAGPDAAKRAKDFFRNFMNRESSNMSDRLTRFMQRATKVACFCEAEDVPTLWRNYADSHRGFCVEYPIDGLPRDDLRVHMMLPVIYSEERFNLINLILRLGGKMNPFVPWLAAIHKSPSWAGEREWRIVLPLGDDSPGTEWLMPTPSRVILGTRASADTRTAVGDIAAAQGFPVYEMLASTSDFGLTARPMVR